MTERPETCTARNCVVCHQHAHLEGEDCRTLARQARHEARQQARAQGWRDYEPEPDPRADCPVRGTHLGMTCQRCHDRMAQHLVELPELYALAAGELLPARGSGTGRGTETSLGLRIGALDLRSGVDVIGVLATWHRDWTEHYDEEPVDWTRRSHHPSDPVGATLVDVCSVMRRGLLRACQSHPGIDVFAQELSDLVVTARQAARTGTARATVVDCPADHDDGTCGARLTITGLERSDVVWCKRCGSRWEVERLLLVVASDRDAGVWLPAEDVALLMRVGERTLRRWARDGHVQRHGGLYELNSVRAAIRAGGRRAEGA